MTERVAFLIKDLVLFAVSFYLMKQDLVRTLTSVKQLDSSVITGNKTPHELAVSKLSDLSWSVVPVRCLIFDCENITRVCRRDAEDLRSSD